jgi:hypothetical protein
MAVMAGPLKFVLGLVAKTIRTGETAGPHWGIVVGPLRGLFGFGITGN